MHPKRFFILFEAATDKLTNVNLNDEYNSAEKGFDKALDQIDKLKQDMSHLCTDIDLLYKSATSKTDDNEADTDNESFARPADNVDDSLLDDLLDWNMHDVFSIECAASSTTSVSQYCDDSRATRHNYKYCKCCKKEIRSSYYDLCRIRKKSRFSLRKSCSSTHLGGHSSRRRSKRAVFKSRSNNNQDQAFSRASINCNRFYNFSYNQ
jgi:hypothetical protein